MSQYRIPAEHNFANLIKTASGAGSEIISCVSWTDTRHVPPLPVQCVDPTGAGDSYLAALAVGLAEGLPLYDACLRGSVAGALATRHVGTAVITREEIEECLPRLLNNTTQL
jgi:sugar/nucleoside kinase (ribokinase family)